MFLFFSFSRAAHEAGFSMFELLVVGPSLHPKDSCVMPVLCYDSCWNFSMVPCVAYVAIGADTMSFDSRWQWIFNIRVLVDILSVNHRFESLFISVDIDKDDILYP